MGKIFELTVNNRRLRTKRVKIRGKGNHRADGPPIFGPGQAGPIYNLRTGPKWADGPSRAPEKPARAKTGQATARHKPSEVTNPKFINNQINF